MRNPRQPLLVAAALLLLGGGWWVSELPAQRIELTPPRHVSIVDILGRENLPLPVEVPDGIAIKEIPPVELKTPPADQSLPPWARKGHPWIESDALEIREVAGQWVELTNTLSVKAPAGAAGPAEYSSGALRLWIYLPTGKVYASPRHSLIYRELTRPDRASPGA